jgi:hypothetical protein
MRWVSFWAKELGAGADGHPSRRGPKPRKTTNRKFRVFPNESAGQNCAKLRIKIPNFPERKGGQKVRKSPHAERWGEGYLIDVEIRLFFGQCWAGCIHLWSIYRLALGSRPQIEDGGA